MGNAEQSGSQSQRATGLGFTDFWLSSFKMEAASRQEKGAVKLYLEFQSPGVLLRHEQAQVGWAEMNEDKGPPWLFRIHPFMQKLFIEPLPARCRGQ